MCSLGVAGFLLLIVFCAHVGRWVRFHWFGTSECVLVVAGMFGFFRVRPRGRWVRSIWPGSSLRVAAFSDSSGCALGVAGFVWVRLVSSGCALGVRLVRSGSSASFGSVLGVGAIVRARLGLGSFRFV